MPDDERHERHDGADDEGVEHALGVGTAAADPDQQGDEHRQGDQQDEQDDPAPAEQAAQGDVDERRRWTLIGAPGS